MVVMINKTSYGDGSVSVFTNMDEKVISGETQSTAQAHRGRKDDLRRSKLDP